MAVDEDYTLLGLGDALSIEKVKRAFRLRAQELHPDKKGGDAKAFMRLKKAYEAIIEDVKAGRTQGVSVKQPVATGQYDPFLDDDYEIRKFFKTERSETEGFERAQRARGCQICHGIGKITKNVHPEKGFFGRETRLCKCQWEQ